MFINRKSNRLFNYNYYKNGYYFITVCTYNRICCLSNIHNGEHTLTNVGKIIYKKWFWIEQQYSYIKLDEFIIMPNHIHGIIIVYDKYKNKSDSGSVGTGLDLSLHSQRKLPLYNIIGAFKTTSCIDVRKNEYKLFKWQRSFHDHIIRNEKELINIRKYIRHNPDNWSLDRNSKRK